MHPCRLAAVDLNGGIGIRPAAARDGRDLAPHPNPLPPYLALISPYRAHYRGEGLVNTRGGGGSKRNVRGGGEGWRQQVPPGVFPSSRLAGE